MGDTTLVDNVVRKDICVRSFVAQVRAGSMDKEKRTFSLVWSTGARVLQPAYRNPVQFEPFYEELSLEPSHVRLGRLNNGAPFLNSHQGRDLSTVLGVVESGTAVVDGKEGTANVRMSSRSEVQPYTQDIADGVIQNVSTGYRVYKFQEMQRADDGVMVLRAIDWEPFELSAVPMGADDGAGVRSQAVETNPCEIVIRSNANQETKQMTPEEIAAQQAELKRQADERAAAEKQAADKAQAAERERVTGISLAVRTAKLPTEFGDKLITEGVSIDNARKLVIDELAKKDSETKTDNHIAIERGQDELDKFVRGAGDWLMQKAGVAPQMEKVGHKVDAGEFRGLSLVDLARMSLERRGVKTRGMDKVRMVGLALTHRAGYQTTSDFSVMFENTMHKMLLAAYAITPDTWSAYCAVGTVTDFRPHNRYELGSFGRLDNLNEHGEFKNKVIPDAAKELIQATTKGNIIGVTRESIINDDMGALARLPFMLGRAAKLSIEIDAYAALALNSGAGPTLQDGKALFHTDHNNISTGAALSAAAIDLDRVKLGSQTDLSGNEVLDLRPSIVLVPLSLGSTARTINDAQYDPDTANKLQKPNYVRNLFEKVVDTARLTGTRRYIFANPNVAPVLEVAFLDGQREPYMESQDGWRTDGVEWKVRLDYAVGGVGYRGAVMNAGT